MVDFLLSYVPSMVAFPDWKRVQAQCGWWSCPTSSDRALYYSHYRDSENQAEGVRP
jgi:hypothetical protein